MYEPNFCVECGTRIHRERWKIWTSRRFCDVCARRFRQRRFVVPLLAAAALIGSGFLWGRSMRPPAPSLIVERRESAAPSLAPQAAAAISNHPNAITAPAPLRYGPDGTANERPTDPDEVVSICGARTKKGTPCSRRVRGTGRCWQHIGKRAALPRSKLIVQGG